MNLPTTPEGFTAEWMTDALRQEGHLQKGKVVSLSVERLDPTKAVFGTLIRLHLRYSGGGDALPATMVAKIPALDPDVAAGPWSTGTYVREIRFYREIGPSAGFSIPYCYGALLDESRHAFVLLMEDLSSSAAEATDAALTVERTRAVVRALARSHALWWESERLESLDWLDDLVSGNERAHSRFLHAWPVVADLLGEGVPDLDKLGNRIAARMVHDRVHLGSPPFLTLVPYDIRAENLFFRGTEDQPEPVFIDFQGVARARGASGLASFLGFHPDRDALEDEVVRLYHDGLVAGGVSGYTIDECRDDYYRGMIRRFIGPASVLGHAKPGTSQWEAIYALVSRFDLSTLRRYVDLAT